MSSSGAHVFMKYASSFCHGIMAKSCNLISQATSPIFCLMSCFLPQHEDQWQKVHGKYSFTSRNISLSSGCYVQAEEQNHFSCRITKESSQFLCCFLVVSSVMQTSERPRESLPLVEMGPIFPSAHSGAIVEVVMSAGSGSDPFTLEIICIYGLKRSKSEKQRMDLIVGCTERAASG